MNDEAWNALPYAARVVIWAGCKSPTRHLKTDLNAWTSFTAIHCALGEIHDVTLQSLAIRSGFALGLLQRA